MKNTLTNSCILVIALTVFAIFVSWGGVWELLLSPLYPDLSEYLYVRVSLWQLTWEHLVIVAVSSTCSIILGVGVGALVTRTYGREFLPALNNLVSIGQTFPPLAVLALAVPAVGFGA
ncbi:MAG: hypothetical protein WBB23_13250, partial [Desulforhopalus sp.]